VGWGCASWIKFGLLINPEVTERQRDDVIVVIIITMQGSVSSRQTPSGHRDLVTSPATRTPWTFHHYNNNNGSQALKTYCLPAPVIYFSFFLNFLFLKRLPLFFFWTVDIPATPSGVCPVRYFF
jgi:hypothetical protein